MNTHTTSHQEIELNCLQRDYESMRMHPANGLSALTDSMRRQGQLVPVVVLAPHPDRPRQWLLLDGYRRVKVAMNLRQDTIIAEVWTGSIAEGLLRLLATQNDRSWTAVEQAQLLLELNQSYGLSLHQLAAKINRHVSFVSRRIALVNDLPDWLLTAVLNNTISLWSVTRSLAPLARANPQHAQALLEYLKKEACSTRELDDFYKHYHRSHANARANMIGAPGLFFKAKKQIKQERLDNVVKYGPEGIWLAQMQKISLSLQQQLNQLDKAFYDNQQQSLLTSLFDAFNQAKEHFSQLDNKLQEINHARQTETTVNP